MSMWLYALPSFSIGSDEIVSNIPSIFKHLKKKQGKCIFCHLTNLPQMYIFFLEQCDGYHHKGSWCCSCETLPHCKLWDKSTDRTVACRVCLTYQSIGWLREHKFCYFLGIKKKKAVTDLVSPSALPAFSCYPHAHLFLMIGSRVLRQTKRTRIKEYRQPAGKTH